MSPAADSSARAFRRAASPAATALAVTGLTKTFPAGGLFAGAVRPPVLADVTFDVAFGDIVGIMGPNGAGKTTLLEIVAGLVEPTAGSVAVSGREVPGRPAETRAAIGYGGAAGQGFYSRMSARWNLEFFGVLDDLSRNEARRRAEDLLGAVGLAHAGSARVETFSDGMRQRLGLARSLIADPAILLLDEPTRGVDPSFRQTVHGLLRRWRDADSRRAIVIVTHDLDEAEALCDRVCLLERGRLAWEGSARGARATMARSAS